MTNIKKDEYSNMNGFSIDFDHADLISKSISSLENDTITLQSDFEDAVSLIGNMPSGYKDNTGSIVSEVKNNLKKLNTEVSGALSAFDQSVSNYYNYENDTTVDKSIEDIERIASLNKFYWEYPTAAGKMNTVDANKLRDLLARRNAKTVDNINYIFSCNGQEYSYNVNTHLLRYKVGNTEFKVYCDFYADDSISASNIDKFDNTVTILGGSSETKRYLGEASRVTDARAVPLGTPISKNSLIVIPTFLIDGSGKLQYGVNSNPHLVTSCTLAGDFLISSSPNQKIENSIIGYSIGGQYATSAIRSNSELYNKCVFVNSASYSDAITNTTAEVGFDGFKNIELIFIESKNNNNWDTAIKKTINTMRNCGVSSDNMKFYTNDQVLVNFAEKNGIAYDLIDNSKYDGHSCGYRMIKDSNILSYLSSGNKGGSY